MSILGRSGDGDTSDKRRMNIHCHRRSTFVPSSHWALHAVDEHGEMKQEVYNLAAFAIEQFVTEVEISKHIKVRSR